MMILMMQSDVFYVMIYCDVSYDDVKVLNAIVVMCLMMMLRC